MIWTNKLGLNESIASAVKNDPYNKGECDFSATELLKPARQRALEIKHRDEIETDVSDRIWSIMGQAVHTILERSTISGVAEERYFAKIDDRTISCQIDLLEENGSLSDYKTSSAWKVKKGSDTSDWDSQLNIQRWILEQNGIEVKMLSIVALLRDWSKLEAARSKDYPQMQVVVLPIPLWDLSTTENFIRERIKAHEEATVVLPLCTPKERWSKPTKFAVKKPGRETAIRVLDTQKEADEYRGGLPKNSELYIEERPGEDVRCRHYCLASQFCTQIKGETK